MLSVRLDEFQLFKVLRLTINNLHRDSGLHLLITLSRKRRIQHLPRWAMNCFATMGDEQFATLGDVDELFATLGETSQYPAKTKPRLSADRD